MRNIHSIYVHHSASSRDNTTRDMISSWHTDGNGWSDIGYHYVIEGDGQIKEGRPVYIIGAHVRGNNSKTVGVCLTGNFEVEEPSNQQLTSLWRLLDGLLTNFGLTRTDVYAHREDRQANTKCCGENLFEHLKKWRNNE